MVDATIGIDHLEGWVEQKLVDGRRQRIRAFGSRAVHIVAGNSPVLSGVSVIRNAVTRSDAIIKTPSNDPLTAVAIARTMCEMDPDHPLTKHLAAAYWKGGDADVEERLYRPEHVEKIVAWGGFASVTHVTRYLQPGLEMIALDPKRSASIIGPEALRVRGDDGRRRPPAGLRRRHPEPGGLRLRPGGVRALGHRPRGPRASSTGWAS